MARDPATILKEALELSSQARARLAAELLRSLDEAEEPLSMDDYDARWGQVIERRLTELDEGTVKAVPWSEARQRIASDE